MILVQWLAGYPDIYETSGLAPLQHHLPNCMMNITCKPGGCLVSQKYLKAVLWWVMLSQKSTWFVIQRYLCCSTLVSSLTLYFVLFGPHWLLMRQVLLFVVRRNNKLGLSAVYSDKIAMEKAEHLSWDLTLELYLSSSWSIKCVFLFKLKSWIIRISW